MFGGRGQYGPYDDTWEYDGQSWVQRFPTFHPPLMSGHQMSYDPARGRIVLFGVPDAGGAPQTWEYDGTNWYPSYATTVPTAVVATAMTQDTVRGRTLLVGGRTDPWPGSRSDETWEYRPVAGASWARYGHGCPGSNGVPVLAPASGSVPALGTTFTLEVSSLPLAPAALYLATGFDPSSWSGVPLPGDLGPLGLPGCTAWVAPDPAYGVFFLHNGSSASRTFNVPNIPALKGLQFLNQAWSFDAAAPGGVGAVSNAGWGRIG